jgi:hypothetical protein
MCRNPIEHLLPRHAPRPYQKAVARPLQYRAPLALQGKQQRRFRRHPHLFVISRPVQSLAPRQQRLVQFLGAFGCRRQQRLRNRVQLVVQRIHQHHPGARQQPRKQPRKGRAITLPRAVTLAQRIAHPSRP